MEKITLNKALIVVLYTVLMPIEAIFADDSELLESKNQHLESMSPYVGLRGFDPLKQKRNLSSTEPTLEQIEDQFQRILHLSNPDKKYVENSSAGPESAFCKEFERDEETHKFTPSVFHTPMGKEGGKCELKDKDGKKLVKVDCDFKKNCLMQGVCIIDRRNGKRIGYNFIKFNIEKRVSIHPTTKRKTTKEIKHSVFAAFDNQRCPFGYGIWSEEHQTSICMDPFRSVAADTKFHKAGDVLFFPALRGLVLPDNSIHNGFMTVRSAGGRILGKHRFDFYTGICKSSHAKKMLCDDYGPKFFTQIGFGQYLQRKDKSCFYSYYKIKDELKEFVLNQRNFPNLPESLVENSVQSTWTKYMSLNTKNQAFISEPKKNLMNEVLN